MGKKGTTCDQFSEDRLKTLLGEMDAAALRQLHPHLETCDTCQNRMERLQFENWMTGVLKRNPNAENVGDDFDFVDQVCDLLVPELETRNVLPNKRDI